MTQQKKFTSSGVENPVSMDLLVIGWDAATRSHLEQFDLPFWESLSHSGSLYPEELFRGTYVSSGNAWTTMTTGARFDQHRIFGFVHGPYDGHPLERPVRWLINRSWLPRIVRRVTLGFVLGNLVTEGGRGANPQSTDVPYKRVWEYLPGNALVFGLPVTYPAWRTNGVIVAGVPAPDPESASAPLTYPSDVEEEVFDDSFSGYHVEMTSPIHDEEESEAAFCEAHCERTELIARKYADLYQSRNPEHDFEFGFLMLRSIDDVLHATTDRELLERIYRKTDTVTQQLVDKLDPDAVMVVSDHGMRPVSWLRQEKNIQMDHDTEEGVWGSTEAFGLSRQIEVTPTVLDYFGVETETPLETDGYETEERRIDEAAVYERLDDLGYA